MNYVELAVEKDKINQIIDKFMISQEHDGAREPKDND